MSITVHDELNAKKYAENWITYDKIEILYKKYPHIISHLTYDIRNATESDFYFPQELATSVHRPIIVTTKINEKLCNLITCNPQTNSGPCNQFSKAQRYPVGDDGKTDVSCQPSCFHLFPKDKTSGQQAQMSLAYHNDLCVMIDPSAKAFMELPSVRAAQPEHRITDIPCGFNRSDHEHPSSWSGIKYHYNKVYCDAFFDEFDEEKKVCYVHWAKKYIGNVILGEYIIKACQALDQYVRTGSDIEKSRMIFEDVESDSNYLLDNWLKNIDSSFVLPYVKVNKLSLGNKGNPDIKPEESYIKGSSRIMNNLHKPKTEINLDAETRRQLELKAKPNFTESSRTKRSSVQPEPNKLFEMLKGFLGQLKEGEFWRDLGLNFSYDGMLLMVRGIFKKLVKRLTGYLATKVMSQTFCETVLRQGLTRAVKAVAFKVASKVTLALLKMMVSALTVVGIIFEVLGVFDILLSIIDPLKLNNKYPADFLDTFMDSSERKFQKQTGLVKPILTFEILSTMLLTQEEIIIIHIKALKYEMEYISKLRVNSQGSVIDSGPKISVEKTDININDYDFINLRLYSQEDLYRYEIDHMTRIKVLDNIKRINYFCTSALIVCLVLQYFLFVIIIMTVICVLGYVQYIALGSEDISQIAYYFA